MAAFRRFVAQRQPTCIRKSKLEPVVCIAVSFITPYLFVRVCTTAVPGILVVCIILYCCVRPGYRVGIVLVAAALRDFGIFRPENNVLHTRTHVLVVPTAKAAARCTQFSCLLLLHTD